MIRQETLLPGTRALPRATVETCRYHGRYLVRYRNMAGVTFRRFFPDADSMLGFARQCEAELQSEMKKGT